MSDSGEGIDLLSRVQGTDSKAENGQWNPSDRISADSKPDHTGFHGPS